MRTQGPWHANIAANDEIPEGGCRVREAVNGHVVAIVMGADDARLVAEAGTVAHETGLSPRQLADQRAELLGALKGLTMWIGKAISDGAFDRCVKPKAAERANEIALAAIRKAEGKEAGK